jgi:hypothetical protein
VRDKATLALRDAIQLVSNVDPEAYQCGVGVSGPLVGQFSNISNAPHFGSIPTAPPLFQISNGQSAAKISETEKTDINPLFFLKGGSTAEILEPNEKEGEVMIITQMAGKASGMTDTDMNIPKRPDWPSKKKNEAHPSLCWWSEILDLKKKGIC